MFRALDNPEYLHTIDSSGLTHKIFAAVVRADYQTVRGLLTTYPHLVGQIALEIGEYGRSMALLHVASGLGYASLVGLLLEFGACVKAVEGMSGATPLHCAALEGRHEVAEILIKHGADVSVKDGSGYSALHLAFCFDQRELGAKLLKARRGK